MNIHIDGVFRRRVSTPPLHIPSTPPSLPYGRYYGGIPEDGVVFAVVLPNTSTHRLAPSSFRVARCLRLNGR